MLLKNVEIYVYKVDDDGTFAAIGEINEFTSLMWPDKFMGYSSFELNAPITSENKNLIKEGNILWIGGDNACMIEIVQTETNEEGEKVYKAKGRTLEMLLTTRIIWGSYNCKDKYSSTAMYEIVDKHCVNPVDVSRKIPFLECAKDEQFGKKISYQKTGGEVYTSLENIASEADLGFDVLFRPREKKLIFKVTQGVDRSVIQAATDSGESLVIFSTDLEDILSSSYYVNNQDFKNIVYVAGEDKGTERKKIATGNITSKGFKRREMYADARDLQSEILNDDGTTTKISDEDYLKMLDERGLEKLSENAKIETFETKMRVFGDVQYIYGVDYYKGDKVIVQDTELGIEVVVKVTEVSENFDDEYELVIVFGYSYPTLIQRIKRQIL